jgi:hypothetical protein
VDKIIGLMTPDHCFTDSLGNEIPSRRAMRDAWLGYLEMVPDYRIDVEEVFEKEDSVVIVGKASGTYSPDGCLDPRNRWSMTAAWRGKVKQGRVHRWQVFADNQPLRGLIRRHSEDDEQ